VHAPKKLRIYLRYLVIAHRKKEGTKHYSQILEKLLLTTIDSKVEDSYSKEYLFEPVISTLDDKMGKVLEANKHLYSHAIKFTKNGFRLFQNGSFLTPNMDFNQLHNLNEDVALLLSMGKPIVKKKKIVYKYGKMKKRDIF